MTISEKSIKLLWSNAAGRCAFPECGRRLTADRTDQSAAYTLGEMAHIKGKRSGSNRFDASQSEEERDGYGNLVLLCPTHHTEIDKPENEARYSVDWLQKAKQEHEHLILSALTAPAIKNIDELKHSIAIHLAENHAAWAKFGPMSERARKNPHSEEMHDVWMSERLATIVPNNRAIVQLLIGFRTLFDTQSQSIISEFLSHARSYERWVNDEISYQSVERFPSKFEDLIKG
jgi:hypothetical protein